MKSASHNSTKDNSGLHPRNKHHARYNFKELIEVNPQLKQFVFVNQYNSETIDFTNALALKTLNQALLQKFYGIEIWDIPENYLCPPIPGRADYIHNIADILALSNATIIPKGKMVHVMDIGVGANCIYPLIGHKEYRWNFTGTDIDPFSVKVARQIIKANILDKSIEIRQQSSPLSIFKGVVKPGELIDITMCNPPFHSSAEEAKAGTERKWKNLGHKQNEKTNLNFGGQHTELWCKGGEIAFIIQMIEESSQLKESCLWFTTLVSKSSNLNSVNFALKKAGALSTKTITMTQGSKISRLVAWTYLNEAQHLQWSLNRWKK